MMVFKRQLPPILTMNRYLCFVLTASYLSVIPAVYAYQPNDLDRLLKTNQCVGCDLSGVNLNGKKLINADLRAANLVGANLSGTNLTGAKLDGANLVGANLVGTNLSGAGMQAINAIDVEFTNTNLTNTDLTYANLANTQFTRALLKNTDFSGANLTRADFTGVNLNNIRLLGANLQYAKGVNQSSPPGAAPSRPIQRKRLPQAEPDRSTPPEVNESGTTFQRPKIYRIPPDLGKPKRLVPGATRATPTPNVNE
jgi:hypothetical protein